MRDSLLVLALLPSHLPFTITLFIILGIILGIILDDSRAKISLPV